MCVYQQQISLAVVGGLDSVHQAHTLNVCDGTNQPDRKGNGGGERDRTDDPLLAKQVLSQLSYTPELRGGSGWVRTSDPRLIKTVL